MSRMQNLERSADEQRASSAERIKSIAQRQVEATQEAEESLNRMRESAMESLDEMKRSTGETISQADQTISSLRESATSITSEITSATDQAATATSQLRGAIDRAESNQAELLTLTQRVATDLTNLIEESRQAVSQHQQLMEQHQSEIETKIAGSMLSLRETEAAVVKNLTSVEDSVHQTSKQAAKRVSDQVRRLDQSVKRLRWTLMGMMMLSGSAIGAGLLMLLLIWQPDLTAQIWQISQ